MYIYTYTYITIKYSASLFCIHVYIYITPRFTCIFTYACIYITPCFTTTFYVYIYIYIIPGVHLDKNVNLCLHTLLSLEFDRKKSLRCFMCGSLFHRPMKVSLTVNATVENTKVEVKFINSENPYFS